MAASSVTARVDSGESGYETMDQAVNTSEETVNRLSHSSSTEAGWSNSSRAGQRTNFKWIRGLVKRIRRQGRARRASRDSHCAPTTVATAVALQTNLSRAMDTKQLDGGFCSSSPCRGSYFGSLEPSWSADAVSLTSSTDGPVEPIYSRIQDSLNGDFLTVNHCGSDVSVNHLQHDNSGWCEVCWRDKSIPTQDAESSSKQHQSAHPSTHIYYVLQRHDDQTSCASLRSLRHGNVVENREYGTAGYSAAVAQAVDCCDGHLFPKPQRPRSPPPALPDRLYGQSTVNLVNRLRNFFNPKIPHRQRVTQRDNRIPFRVDADTGEMVGHISAHTSRPKAATLTLGLHDSPQSDCILSTRTNTKTTRQRGDPTPAPSCSSPMLLDFSLPKGWFQRWRPHGGANEDNRTAHQSQKTHRAEHASYEQIDSSTPKRIPSFSLYPSSPSTSASGNLLNTDFPNSRDQTMRKHMGLSPSLRRTHADSSHESTWEISITSHGSSNDFNSTTANTAATNSLRHIDSEVDIPLVTNQTICPATPNPMRHIYLPQQQPIQSVRNLITRADSVRTTSFMPDLPKRPCRKLSREFEESAGDCSCMSPLMERSMEDEEAWHFFNWTNP